MRTRAALGALSGALALSAFTAPAAGAAGTVTDIKNIVVNGGKPVVIGVNGTVSVPVTMSLEPHALNALAKACISRRFIGLFPFLRCRRVTGGPNRSRYATTAAPAPRPRCREASSGTGTKRV